nr:zinc finger, CCHC-type [Tanacetum cinerariifolium]
MKRAKWDSDDYVCRGLILNGMSNHLFHIYQNVESFKELCDSLEAKYMADYASSKKFLVAGLCGDEWGIVGKSGVKWSNGAGSEEMEVTGVAGNLVQEQYL